MSIDLLTKEERVVWNRFVQYFTEEGDHLVIAAKKAMKILDILKELKLMEAGE